MTPQEAKALVDKASQYIDDDVRGILAETVDAGVLADAVLTLAKMTPVYDYEIKYGNAWVPQDYEFTTLEAARERIDERTRRAPARIVAHYVTGKEVVE